MSDRPRLLIEEWLPIQELGIESRRERAAASALPPLSFLHVWWARRPLVASAGVILGCLLPAWSNELEEEFPGDEDSGLSPEAEYHRWFLRICGVLGDPVAAKRLLDAANAAGEKLKGNGYGYKQAYKNSPPVSDVLRLHQLLRKTWGDLPTVIDPTAGGGSIPFEAIRYRLPATANDLNAVAASILRASVEVVALFGDTLLDELKTWGRVLASRVERRMSAFFPLAEGEEVIAYIFARSVACPRTGKMVPLAPDWWLRRENAKEVAVRLRTEGHDGAPLETVEFEIVTGKAAVEAKPAQGTVSGGDGISPWDGLAIEGDYIKAEAQAGRMGSVLYAVAVRQDGTRSFRSPTRADLTAISAADEELRKRLTHWADEGFVPTEEVPLGNDTRPHQYGMGEWARMFSPRQLLVHGTFAEEFVTLIPEVRSAISDRSRADAILALLGLMQGKALNYNSYLSSWHAPKQVMRSVFDRHDFAFKWTYAEFEGARALYGWCLEQLLDSYRGLCELLKLTGEGEMLATSARSSVTVTRRNGADLDAVADASQTLVCIDPPYYDNVMYAELADFFSVWESRTVGRIWSDIYDEGALTDKKNEAVANPARFDGQARRRRELATADYEAKMAAIFSECGRVLRDDGVLAVMFTHKRAEAWDTLGMGLMQAGFTIETSWPVNTESENSLHQTDKNAASSTVMLVCRKRETGDGSALFFEDIEADVRSAAREALTRFASQGISGVDLLLATYGPALSVISSRWPVYSSEADPDTGRSRLLRPEEALDAARAEVVRLQRERLVGHATQLDAITDFVLIAWDTFKAASFPYDEARRLALAVGGLDVDELARAKVVTKKSGTVVLLQPHERVRRRSEVDATLPGVRIEATSFPVAIDAVHTAMYIAEADGAAAAKAFLDRNGLTTDTRFLATLTALVRAIPRSKTKDGWTRPEAGTLDSLCVAYFPDVVRLEVPEPVEQRGLFDGAD